MEINVRDDRRLVEVWLTNTERENGGLLETLKPLYRDYAEKKYRVAVFQSGKSELYALTRDLLRRNRRRIAQLEVEREKQKRPAELESLSHFPSVDG